jgi:hypothetical protein
VCQDCTFYTLNRPEATREIIANLGLGVLRQSPARRKALMSAAAVMEPSIPAGYTPKRSAAQR